MKLFLSGHGSSDTLQTYKLPCQLVTFCAFGDGLDIPRSWKIFDLLAAGDLNGLIPYVYKTHAVGESVPEMTLYPTNDFTSGIFEVGSKMAKMSGNSGVIKLRDILRVFRSTEAIYWIACLS